MGLGKADCRLRRVCSLADARAYTYRWEIYTFIMVEYPSEMDNDDWRINSKFLLTTTSYFPFSTEPGSWIHIHITICFGPGKELCRGARYNTRTEYLLQKLWIWSLGTCFIKSFRSRIQTAQSHSPLIWYLKKRQMSRGIFLPFLCLATFCKLHIYLHYLNVKDFVLCIWIPRYHLKVLWIPHCHKFCEWIPVISCLLREDNHGTKLTVVLSLLFQQFWIWSSFGLEI